MRCLSLYGQRWPKKTGISILGTLTLMTVVCYKKNSKGESGENPQNVFSSISPKKNNISSIIRINQHFLNVHYTGLIHAIKMVCISIESP